VNLSIVVPAFNEERVLGATLASIEAAGRSFDAAGIGRELIVCDNNSTDRTAQIAAAAGARVVFEPINQIARARNTGARHATGDWLLFIDADSHPSPELCADAARVMLSGRSVAGGSTIAVGAGEPRAVHAVCAAWNLLSRAARWAAGSFFFCDSGTFRAVGGFSERLYVSEDVDLCRRVKRVARCRGPSIAILHRHPLRTSARKAHLYTSRELAAWYVKVLLTGGRPLRSARHSPIWYDGRR